ncbi:MAG: hypothetical protein PUD55_02255 [Firmicutes bacterium]|nr:hypothetical protein [Bacillota bacterium]
MAVVEVKVESIRAKALAILQKEFPELQYVVDPYILDDYYSGQIDKPRVIYPQFRLPGGKTEEADIARCHAIGQACGTVHTNGHAVGHPIYELTAIIRENGIDGCEAIIQDRLEYYVERLFYWKDNYASASDKWADFLLR